MHSSQNDWIQLVLVTFASFCTATFSWTSWESCFLRNMMTSSPVQSSPPSDSKLFHVSQERRKTDQNNSKNWECIEKIPGWDKYGQKKGLPIDHAVKLCHQSQSPMQLMNLSIFIVLLSKQIHYVDEFINNSSAFKNSRFSDWKWTWLEE